jgi:hypothetical protein
MNHDGSSEHGQQRRGPFDVDEDRALSALDLAWGAEYDEFWVSGGEWGAHHKDAGEDDVLTGAAPDELNRAIRADCARRGAL